MITLIIAALLSQSADIASTMMVLRAGGREANPAMAWIMRRFGRAWPLVKAGVAMAAIIGLDIAGFAVLSWLVVVAFFAIAARNLVVLGRMQ